MAPKKSKGSNSIKPSGSPLEKLRAALCLLVASGPKGFEGLMRDLFEQLLGRSIYLMKSGSQGGGDAYTGSFPDQLSIVWEDKRYQLETDLSISALRDKLDQACNNYPEMDIWALIATKEIAAQDVRDLEAKGKKEGVGVLVIDYPEQVTRLSGIAALCAQYPDILQQYTTDISSHELNGIKLHPQLQCTLDSIRQKLDTPELSYSQFQLQTKNYINKAFTNKDEAMQKLGCYGNIQTAPDKYIKRKTISDYLNAWWCNPEHVFAIVHGQEGRGKSWSVFYWLHENQATLPLTIIIPAQNLGSSNIAEELAKALQKSCTETEKDLSHFQKRLIRIRNHSKKSVKLLVIIDGLNQNYDFAADYESLLLPLAGEEWYGCAKVILTSRTGFLDKHNWLEKLERNSENKCILKKIQVPEFSEQELNEFFVSRNLKSKEFEPEILKLAAIPRYADLVARHVENLKGVQVCTLEHLFLLDWKDRVTRKKRSLGVSAQEFMTIIHDLAQKARASHNIISLTEVKNAVKNHTTIPDRFFNEVVDELAQDSWLVDTGKKSLLTFSSDWAIAALSLVLKNELDSEPFDEAYARFIEPMNAADHASQIVYSAILQCLISQTPELEKARFFVNKLLDLQNQSKSFVGHFWIIAVVNPGFFLDIIEQQVHKHGASQQIDFLKRSILMACEKDISKNCESQLRLRLNNWLSRVVIEQSKTLRDHIEKIRKDRESGINLSLLQEEGYPFNLSEDEHYDCYPHSFDLLSCIGLDDTSTKGIISWLIGHYLYPCGGEKSMEWILRIHATPSQLMILKEIISTSGGLTERAKVDILKTLAYLSANSLLGQYVDLTKQVNTPFTRDVQIARDCENPEFTFSNVDDQYVNEKIQSMDWSRFNLSLGETAEESAYENLRLYLARQNPVLLKECELKTYASHHVEPIGKRSFFFRHLQLSWILLHDSPIVSKDVHRLIDNLILLSKNRYGHDYSPLLFTKLFALSNIERLKFIASLPETSVISTQLVSVFDPVSFSSNSVLGIMNSCQNDTQKALVLCFSTTVGIESFTTDFDEYLLSCIKSATKILRTSTIRAIVCHGSKPLKQSAANLIRNSNASLQNIDDTYEIHLLLSNTNETLSDIHKWCHPQFFPVAIKARQYCKDDIQEFAIMTEKHLQGMLKGNRLFWGKHWSWRLADQDDENVFELLIDVSPEIVDTLEQLSDSDALISAMDDFPIRNILIVLWKKNPDKAQTLWVKIRRLMKYSSSESEILTHVPYRMTSSFENSIRILFSNANTDQKLQEFCYQMYQGSKIDLLQVIIMDGLKSDNTAIKAKVLVLLGFCISSPSIEVIWSATETQEYQFGWLRQIKKSSLEWYQKGKGAKHWYTRFIQATDRTNAFAAYLLFQQCFDMRVWIWLKDCWNNDLQKLTHESRAFFLLQSEQREIIVKKLSSKLRHTLGYHPICTSMHPWWE